MRELVTKSVMNLYAGRGQSTLAISWSGVQIKPGHAGPFAEVVGAHSNLCTFHLCAYIFTHIYIPIYGWLSRWCSLLGTPNIRCRIIIGIQKGTIILTTTHIGLCKYLYRDT